MLLVLLVACSLGWVFFPSLVVLWFSGGSGVGGFSMAVLFLLDLASVAGFHCLPWHWGRCLEKNQENDWNQYFHGESYYHFQKLPDFPNVVITPACMAGVTLKVWWTRQKLYQAKYNASMAWSFSHFFEKALVSRVSLPHLHSHSQVLTLDVRSADLFHVGIPEYGNLFASDAFGGGVAGLVLRVRSIQLDQLGEVNALCPKTQHNGILIRA